MISAACRQPPMWWFALTKTSLMWHATVFAEVQQSLLRCNLYSTNEQEEKLFWIASTFSYVTRGLRGNYLAGQNHIKISRPILPFIGRILQKGYLHSEVSFRKHKTLLLVTNLPSSASHHISNYTDWRVQLNPTLFQNLSPALSGKDTRNRRL